MSEKVRATLYCLYQIQKEKLEKLAKHFGLSQSAVIRKLIEEAYEQDLNENKN